MMTKGLEKSSVMKLKLYKSTLSPKQTLEDMVRYKTHRNLYNILKPTTKEKYYREKCLQFKQNSKKLWGIINETIKKVKHKGSLIPYITVDGIKLNKPKDIANNFGSFFSKLGSTLAAKIVPGMTNINDHISNIPRQILELIGYILQAKNKGEHTASIFLDLSKEFDTLEHDILLSKLKRYGVRGTPIN